MSIEKLIELDMPWLQQTLPSYLNRVISHYGVFVGEKRGPNYNQEFGRSPRNLDLPIEARVAAVSDDRGYVIGVTTSQVNNLGLVESSLELLSWSNLNIRVYGRLKLRHLSDCTEASVLDAEDFNVRGYFGGPETADEESIILSRSVAKQLKVIAGDRVDIIEIIYP